MLSFKLDTGGYVDILPESVQIFEEAIDVEEGKTTKAVILYDIGEGLSSASIENSYDVVKSTVKNGNLIEVNSVGGGKSRRITVPRNSIIFRQELITPEDADESVELPKTLIKLKLEGSSVIPLNVRESRDELDLL